MNQSLNPYKKFKPKESTSVRVPKEFLQVIKIQSAMQSIPYTDYLRNLTPKLKPTNKELEDFYKSLEEQEYDKPPF
jgi:predicted DNA binding CopG/RHH family protein